MKYQGLYETTDGRLGWFEISKLVYEEFLKGEKMLCRDVRIVV